jgi:hypothetical protein
MISGLERAEKLLPFIGYIGTIEATVARVVRIGRIMFGITRFDERVGDFGSSTSLTSSFLVDAVALKP